MAYTPFYFAFAFLFLLSASPADAFNITKILSEYSDFSAFNDGLTQTGLAGSINSRQTITVLVVSNGGLSGLSGDTLKAVLSLHVVLDYYDVEKLQQLPNKSSTLTTLFQTSGQATGKEGFLNVTKTGSGVVFGSAVPGSSLNSNLVKSVTSQPYNISVLQVSSVIRPPGLGGGSSNSSSNSTSPASSPTKSPPGSPASSPAPKSSPPASPPKGGNPPSEAPAPSDASAPAADSPSNATAPAADSPSNATAPAADTPTSTPASSPADGPAGEAPAADAPAHKSASADTRPRGHLILGIGVVVWCLVSSIV